MKLLAALFLTGVLLAGEVKLGKPLQLQEALPVSEVIARSDSYVDKTVQVKGKVTEVCQMMGCWMAIADPATGKSIRIQVNDGEIVFPKDAAGKTAVAEGKLVKLSLTKAQAIAQAKHEAEEQGHRFDPRSVKAAATNYQIQGTGAVILD